MYISNQPTFFDKITLVRFFPAVTRKYSFRNIFVLNLKKNYVNLYTLEARKNEGNI